jgi:hypothetical protein
MRKEGVKGARLRKSMDLALIFLDMNKNSELSKNSGTRKFAAEALRGRHHMN